MHSQSHKIFLVSLLIHEVKYGRTFSLLAENLVAMQGSNSNKTLGGSICTSRLKLLTS